jgi:hypothetical protein
MATSDVEICNSAITKIGGATIMSLSDETVEAATCNLRLDPCRRIVLRMHPWNCAIGRVELAPDVDVPAFDFTSQFTLPADCLRVLEVADDIEYRIEGRKIVSDGTSISLKYLKNVTDPTQLDELVSEAIACYLAYDIAYKVTQKTSVQDACWKQLQLVLRQAKTVDAQEERDYEIQANTLLESRIGSPTIGRSNR